MGAIVTERRSALQRGRAGLPPVAVRGLRCVSEGHLVERTPKLLLADFEGIARIGVGEVDFRTRVIRWSDGLYDLYEIERGRPVTIEEIAALYSPDSLERLQAAMEGAIGSSSASPT
jgi:hypothetical protein